MPRGRLSTKQETNANIAGPDSRTATCEDTLKIFGHGIKEYTTAQLSRIIPATPISIKNVLDTYFRATFLSSFPFASEIAFNSPLPIPRSAKLSIATNEVIVIQRPYRSVPRYRTVSRTEIRFVRTEVPLAMIAASAVSAARR